MPTDSSRLFVTLHPRVVATISSAAGWAMARKLTPHDAYTPDLLEVRADLLVEKTGELPGALKDLPLPFILTVRGPEEGGRGARDAGDRAIVYQKYLAQAVAIDIELASGSELSELVREAQLRNVAVIFSYHDFAGTSSRVTLADLTSQALALGADLFKVAVMTRSAAQLNILSTWLEEEKRLPLSAMGMGTLGKISRPLLAQLGSQLNYGFLDAPVVSGQWPANELQHLIRSLLI